MPLQQTLAIVSEGDVQQSGFSDLLFAELTKETDFRLVERDRVAAVVRELELTGTIESDSATIRKKLGQMTGANTVVILKNRTTKDSRAVTVIICDCKQGG